MVRNSLSLRNRPELNIDPVFERLFGRSLDMPVWSGGFDVEEFEDRAIISLDVPGVTPEQIGIDAENRTLTVRVEREGKGSFSKQYTVGPRFNLEDIQAKLALGVLTLTLPKAEEAQPRQIPITVD